MKKNCRMTLDERKQHDEAVRLRKMTDQQLVAHVRHIQDTSYRRGYNAAMNSMPQQSEGESLEAFIKALSDGRCKGIKSAMASKIMDFARTEGYIS